MSVTPFRKPPEPAVEAGLSSRESAQAVFDSHTIFKRTEAGNAEFRNRASLLPQRLKSILLLVDSRTTVEKFVASLSVYGDISDLFQVLLDMGFIEPLTPHLSGIRASVATPVADPNKIRIGPAKTGRFDDEVSRRSESATQPQSFGTTMNNDLIMRRAINQLTDWVPDLFPENSLDVMFELDKCRSREEFVLTMNDLLPVMQKVWGTAETKRRITELQLILAGK
jgi:hypothetical protein